MNPISLIYSGKGEYRPYLSWSMYLTTARSLYPAIFSTARLIREATIPVRSPTRNASNHFKKIYWSTWTFDLLLQSCLNRSFSLILNQERSKLSMWETLAPTMASGFDERVRFLLSRGCRSRLLSGSVSSSSSGLSMNVSSADLLYSSICKILTFLFR